MPADLGPGVAPGAKLYALKVFGCAGSTAVTSQAIEWAMDPNGDGDMSDHLDVINMSLGSTFGDPNDPTAITTVNATKVGIIVATSAGNSGDVSYVTGSPGTATEAISTAATTPGGRISALFDVNSPAALAGAKLAVEGTSPVRMADSAAITSDLAAVVPANGCTTLTNPEAVAGKIALVIRGGCSFAAKSASAEAAGALAMVVYNDGTAANRIAPITMGGLGDATIASVMISFTDGNAIATSEDTTNGTLSAGESPFLADAIAGFSSRGPGAGGSRFKPDLSNPGVQIVSSLSGSGVGGASFNGTSMASPHTAGMAALLRQQHPDMSVGDIKALLMNSTVDVNPSADTRLTRAGVGAARIDRAMNLTSLVTPAGVSFGRLTNDVDIFKEIKVRLKNLGKTRREFGVTHVPNQTYPGVDVFCPDYVDVGKGRSRTAKIKLYFNVRAAWDAGVFDNASNSQAEVDGWCVFSDGVDTLRVGYMAVVDAASATFVLPKEGGVEVSNEGPAPSFADGFTLIGRGGEGAEAGAAHGIEGFAFRRGDPAQYGGADVVELAIATKGTWNHISNTNIFLYIDADKDGVDDVLVRADDLSAFQNNVTLGQYITAQFSLTGGGAFLDWNVGGWDFNDRVIVIPFTTAADTVFGGLVPESFNYRLEVDPRNGTTDVQTGTVDFADEIVLDSQSMALVPGESATANVTSGRGRMMWIFPNDVPDRGGNGQVGYVRARPAPEAD